LGERATLAGTSGSVRLLVSVTGYGLIAGDEVVPEPVIEGRPLVLG
jgi:hypothetical protein